MHSPGAQPTVAAACRAVPLDLSPPRVSSQTRGPPPRRAAMNTRNTVMGIRMWEPPVAPAQVVIVEADTGIRTLLEELLADEGYAVRSQPLPDGLPTALDADPPDLLLIDCLTSGL